MAAAKDSKVLLTIAGAKVPVAHEAVPIGSLRLNPSNPRIRFLLQHRGGSKSQDSLAALIKEQPGYDSLQKAIRKAGGLHDPVIISHDGLVIEGNTRTTAVLTLHEGSKTDPDGRRFRSCACPKAFPNALWR